MSSKTLRVRARGTASVPNHEAEAAGVRRFVGRKYIEVEPGVWGFQPTGEVEELPYSSDYVKHVKDGELWPADKATAEACGVEFDATFGETASYQRHTSNYPDKG